MKYIITEEQYRKLNKSSDKITNFIIKYMNEYISNGKRKYTNKSRNYGNLGEVWCIDGKGAISTYYNFDEGKFDKGTLLVDKEIVETISKIFSVKPSYVLHVIEEWYEDVMIPKFEKIVGESGLYINVIDTKERTYECIPEATKPEGITDEEMIDFIVNNTLYRKPEVIKKIESGERDLEDFYLDIVDTVKGKEIRGF